jgi:hypothetical protein
MHALSVAAGVVAKPVATNAIVIDDTEPRFGVSIEAALKCVDPRAKNKKGCLVAYGLPQEPYATRQPLYLVNV